MTAQQGGAASELGFGVSGESLPHDRRRLIAGLDNATGVISELMMGSGGGPYSLVKGTKCLTGLLNLDLPHGIDRLPPIVQSGTFARLARREWSGEYRLRCVADMSKGKAPPAQSGDRITRNLSARGAAAIQDSCEYLHLGGEGYKTFLTLTLSEENRKRFYRRVAVLGSEVVSGEKYKRTICKIWRSQIDKERIEGAGLRILDEAEGDYCSVTYTPNYVSGVLPDGPYTPVSFPWELTLSTEVSRFANSIGKMRLRGWVPRYRRSGVVKVGVSDSYCPIQWNHDKERLSGTEPVKGKLPYLWVAECPQNKNDMPNPHVHMLLSWSMPWRLFPAWAKRVEAIWGLGFAKLEIIRDTEKSAYYIAKAAGYLSKGQGSGDQGEIRGNRYGIASVSRAPGWVSVGVWSWGVLGHIISEARSVWWGIIAPMRKKRDELLRELGDVGGGDKWGRRRVLASVIDIRKKISRLPMVVGAYNVIFKQDSALLGFVNWAKQCGWSMSEHPSHPWLEEFKKQLDWSRDQKVAIERSSVSEMEWASIIQNEQDWQRLSVCEHDYY